MANRKTRRASSKTAPQAASGDTSSTIAEATQNATTKDNPASTTSAADPERDGTVQGDGTASEMVNGTDGATGPTGGGSTEGQAAGERHSHPAATTAERILDGATGGTDDDAARANTQATELLAGTGADPANNPSPEGEAGTIQSRHDESGAIQDATRQAIGAGNGAPDGIGDDPAPFGDGVDVPEEIEPADAGNGITFHGNKALLWRMLENGATHDDMKAQTKYVSAVGTIYAMAEEAGREIKSTKDAKGVKTYKLAPAKN